MKRFFYSSILCLLLFSCHREDTTPDYAKKVTGTYYVTEISSSSNSAFINDPNDYIQITRTGTNIISMYYHLVNSTSYTGTIANINTSDGGNGKVNLNYRDATGTLTGWVYNNKLSYTLSANGETLTLDASK